ncbi:MAG: hypothetical protein AAF297_08890 [Planctomycetota bacterium]
MLQSTPVQQSETVSGFQRADGSSARVMAVAPRQATPQDSGVPVIAGVAAYLAALPALALVSCLVFALGSF